MTGDLRAALQSNEVVYGPFVKTCSPLMVEIMGLCQFDYVLLDMEHSPVSMESLEALIRAAELADIFPFVRVAGMNEADFIHPLDKGARGLLVPMVNSAAAAQRAVEFSKFAPAGKRGIDVYARSAKFGFTPKDEYFKQANETILAVQIEGAEGIANLDEILAVPSIDIIYIGPYDLSQSLGIPGRVTDPRLFAEVERICEKTRASGKWLGAYVDSVVIAKQYRGIGVQFLSVSVDARIFANACCALIEELKTP